MGCCFTRYNHTLLTKVIAQVLRWGSTAENRSDGGENRWRLLNQNQWCYLTAVNAKEKICGIEVQAGNRELNHKAKGVRPTRLVVYTKDFACGFPFHLFFAAAGRCMWNCEELDCITPVHHHKEGRNAPHCWDFGLVGGLWHRALSYKPIKAET